MFVFVSGIQAAVRGLKHGLRPAGIGIVLMPKWASLRASGNIESVISRNVSNFLMTA